MACLSSAVAELQLIMKLTVEAHCSTDETQAAVSYSCSIFSGSPIYYFRSQTYNISAVSIASKTLAYLYFSQCLLPFDRGAAKAWSQAYFGEGSGPVLLDEVQCTGNELSIEQCPKSSWREHNCDHKEDAGVSCTPLTGSSITNKYTRKAVANAELTALEREFLKFADA